MKIKEIIMINLLLVSVKVKSQEFYTCVPKRDWWIEIIREGSKKLWNKKIFTNNSSVEKYFEEILEPGKYRITQLVEGETIMEEYIVNERLTFDACIGTVSKDWRKSNSCFSETGMYFKFDKNPELIKRVVFPAPHGESISLEKYIIIEKLK